MGGGVMRTAAKVVGIGVVNGGLRGVGFSAVPPAEHSMVRSASKPVSAAIASVSQTKIDEVAAVQRPSWEIDDWEFADSEEELVASDAGGEPMSRLVFGGAPSLQEAVDATNELKDALEKVYLLSPRSHGFEDLSANGHASGPSLLSNAESVESNTSVSCDTRAPPLPKHAMQAFALLSESAAAQSVVAKITADPNVWNAVLQNEALVEFLEYQKTNAMFQDTDFPKQCEELSHDFSKKYEELSDENQHGNTGSAFMDAVQNVKKTVLEMVSNVSAYLESIFGLSSADNNNVDADGKARSSFNVDKTLGASFMALAVMAIMVVVLRRV